MQRMYPQALEKLLANNLTMTGLFLERIRQFSLVDYVFEFNKRQNIFISLNNEAPFIVFNADLSMFPPGGELHSFAIDLRRFMNGRLVNISQVENDTVLKLEFAKRNNVLEHEIVTLFIELIPRHPQAVLINEARMILAAFRYNHERGKDGRLLRRGTTYKLPLKQETINVENVEFDYLKNYLATYGERIKKQNYRPLYVYLEHNLKRLKRLVINYRSDLEKLHGLEKLYSDANTLLMEKPPIKGPFVDINGEPIAVDPRYNAITNAELLFKRAKKIKKSEEILQQRIKETTDRINYLTTISEQLPLLHTDEEIKAIYAELSIKEKTTKTKQITKQIPYYLTYENINIMYGKNNIQNDYLTFKIARKNDTFLHIKNRAGSHIVISSDKPSKKVLEFAGKLALFLSRVVDGEISYALVNTIKKGAFPGQVIMRQASTFFVRADETSTKIFQSESKRLF